MGERVQCLARSGGAAVSAHRGGPAGPENSLTAIQASLAAGVTMIELDVALSRDGKVVLMHDRAIDRTTTATGAVSDYSQAQLAQIQLKDRMGEATPETVPTLAQALSVTRDQAVISVDFKPASRPSDASYSADLTRLVRAVARDVRAAQAQQRVVLIVYSPRDARLVRRVARWATLSISANSVQDLAEYGAQQIQPGQSLVFTGAPRSISAISSLIQDPALPTILGTLGAPGRRLDDQFSADGDLSDYAALVRQGADVVATDQAITVQRALEQDLGPAAMQTARQCLVG